MSKIHKPHCDPRRRSLLFLACVLRALHRLRVATFAVGFFAIAQFALPCTNNFYLPWLIHFLKIKRARIIFLKVVMTRFIHKNVLDTIDYNI